MIINSEVFFLIKNCSLSYSYIAKDNSSESLVNGGVFSSLLLLQEEIYKIFHNKDYVLVYEYSIQIDFCDDETYYTLDVVPMVTSRRRNKKFYCTLSIGKISDESFQRVFVYRVFSLTDIYDQLLIKGYLNRDDLNY